MYVLNRCRHMCGVPARALMSTRDATQQHGTASVTAATTVVLRQAERERPEQLRPPRAMFTAMATALRGVTGPVSLNPPGTPNHSFQN